MNSIYQEIVETLQAISADLEDETGYTDYEPAECAGFIDESFAAVWEDR